MGRRVEILSEMFAALPFDEARFFSLPCVYMMAHEEGDTFVVHYVGQTSKLNQRYASHHQLAAAKDRGATHVLVLVVRDARDRLSFETMMRWFYKPPLNAEAVPTHMQAWRAAMHCGKADIAELARASHMTCERGLLPPMATRPVAARV
jgi:predicted GIY-YIG superfamily endonuclease